MRDSDSAVGSASGVIHPRSTCSALTASSGSRSSSFASSAAYHSSFSRCFWRNGASEAVACPSGMSAALGGEPGCSPPPLGSCLSSASSSASLRRYSWYCSADRYSPSIHLPFGGVVTLCRWVVESVGRCLPVSPSPCRPYHLHGRFCLNGRGGRDRPSVSRRGGTGGLSIR